MRIPRQQVDRSGPAPAVTVRVERCCNQISRQRIFRLWSSQSTVYGMSYLLPRSQAAKRCPASWLRPFPRAGVSPPVYGDALDLCRRNAWLFRKTDAAADRRAIASASIGSNHLRNDTNGPLNRRPRHSLSTRPECELVLRSIRCAVRIAPLSYPSLYLLRLRGVNRPALREQLPQFLHPLADRRLVPAIHRLVIAPPSGKYA